MERESLILNILKVVLKVIVFLILVVIFFVVGLMIGYAVIGDGNFWEVLNQDTWQHIVQFVKP